MAIKFSAQGDKKFKEKPNYTLNKGNGYLRARSLPAELPTCGKELKLKQ